MCGADDPSLFVALLEAIFRLPSAAVGRPT
jgi:hypothetical protein